MPPRTGALCHYPAQHLVSIQITCFQTTLIHDAKKPAKFRRWMQRIYLGRTKSETRRTEEDNTAESELIIEEGRLMWVGHVLHSCGWTLVNIAETSHVLGGERYKAKDVKIETDLDRRLKTRFT